MVKCFRNVHRVLVYGMDSRGDPKAVLRTGEDNAPSSKLNIQFKKLNIFSLCHNDLESYWHLVDGERTVPRREELSCVPTGLSNRRNVKYLDIQVGEKPGHHYLNLDPKPILYKNTKELMHGFRNL